MRLSNHLRRGVLRPRKRVTDLAKYNAWVAQMRSGPGIFIPLRTENELNDHKHYRVRQQRAARQHEAVAAAMMGTPHTPPASVMLTRYSPKQLDPFDGLPASFKFVVDALCEWWGIDDGPGCPVKFACRQEKAKYFGVKIEMEHG